MRWGIVSTGNISTKFAEAFSRAPKSAQLVAVSSRTQKAANAFASQHGIPRAFSSADQMFESGVADIIYIGALHPYHLPLARAALETGHHVLCEKPMTMCSDDTQRLIELAQARGLFLMEAIWARFLPVFQQVDALIQTGSIGSVRSVEASFSLGRPFDPNNRLYAPHKGGGAMLDLGIYPLWLATWLLGPGEIDGLKITPAPSGVDDTVSLTMRHEGEATSRIGCSISEPLGGPGTIIGSEGRIEIPSQFYCAQELTATRNGESRTIACPMSGNGYAHEIAHVEDCLARGMMESPALPHSLSLELARKIDAVIAATPSVEG
ncbi:MAG: Gfo/Idh/MocA family oxidoreductase [Pseudomonadota bacterium]